MPYSDKTKQQEYQRDLMRRRRATDAAVETQQTTQGKCFLSDMNVCILYLSPDGKPIYCNGIKKTCEGKPEDIKQLPFGPKWTGFRREAA